MSAPNSAEDLPVQPRAAPDASTLTDSGTNSDSPQSGADPLKIAAAALLRVGLVVATVSLMVVAGTTLAAAAVDAEGRVVFGQKDFGRLAASFMSEGKAEGLGCGARSEASGAGASPAP